MDSARSVKWIIAACLLLSACGSPASDSAAPAPASTPVPPLAVGAVMNMSYTMTSLNAAPNIYALTDGIFQRGTDVNSQDYVLVQLLKQMAFGDLNGDNAGDAAVLLAENFGGTGTFVSLIAVLNQGGKPVQAGVVAIDDRPNPHSLKIESGKVILDTAIHSFQDPMCCPAFEVKQTYGLTKGGLTLQNFVSKTPSGAERKITIESPANGAQVFGAVQVKGNVTVAPFENNLVYSFYDGLGNKLTQGPIKVQAKDLGGPGIFDGNVPLNSIPAGLVVRLEVADLSAADGSILAMDSVELVVK